MRIPPEGRGTAFPPHRVEGTGPSCLEPPDAIRSPGGIRPLQSRLAYLQGLHRDGKDGGIPRPIPTTGPEGTSDVG